MQIEIKNYYSSRNSSRLSSATLIIWSLPLAAVSLASAIPIWAVVRVGEPYILMHNHHWRLTHIPFLIPMLWSHRQLCIARGGRRRVASSTNHPAAPSKPNVILCTFRSAYKNNANQNQQKKQRCVLKRIFYMTRHSNTIWPIFFFRFFYNWLLAAACAN